MDAKLASLVRDWHDFYALVGTAAATLVGLMFVAASIGAGIFNEKHLEPMKAFITPTVVHFSAALFICILATIPTQTWAMRGLLVGCGGLGGLIIPDRFGCESSTGSVPGAMLLTGSSTPSFRSWDICWPQSRRWRC
jgi:hypothetical protein